MNEVNAQVEKKTLYFKDYPLDTQIKRALSELGFVSPLEVQEAVIPKILEGTDLVVKSQTGSGKTAAFGIPLCERVDVELEATQVIVLTPTRELCAQVKDSIQEIGKFKGVRCLAIYGQQPIDIQRKELKKHPHIVVATPGRLLDHLKNKNIKLNQVKYFVIDEADEMLLMGFKDQMDFIVSKMAEERTTLLFSATMPEEVHALSALYMNSPETIEIEAEVPNIEKIEQLYYAVDGLRKVDFMKKMIRHENPKKAIIFCNTKEQVDNLFEIFRKWENATCAVHGGMDQGLRAEKLKAFKKGQYKILIATDVAARGLHVTGITHVINYGVPFDHENYVHRIGRTGRVDQNGVAITMVIPSEMDRFKALEKFLGYEIPCRGGYVDKKPKADQNRRIRENYKLERNRIKGVTIQIDGGKNNSNLKAGDVLSAIRTTRGINNQDIGRVEVKDQYTNVTIYNGKEAMVMKTLKTRRLKGKEYRIRYVEA